MIEKEIKLYAQKNSNLIINSFANHNYCNHLITILKSLGIHYNKFVFSLYYDEYYDTPNFQLLKENSSLRFRKCEDTVKIILKTNFIKNELVLIRKEKIQQVPVINIDYLKKFCAEVFPSPLMLQKQVGLNIYRYNIYIETYVSDYNLVFDKYEYIKNKNQKISSPHYEIEIEEIHNFLDSDDKQITQLVNELKKQSFFPTTTNRYERWKNSLID